MGLPLQALTLLEERSLPGPWRKSWRRRDLLRGPWRKSWRRLDRLCGRWKRHALSALDDDGLALVGKFLVHHSAVLVPLDQGRQPLLLVVPHYAAPSSALEVRKDTQGILMRRHIHPCEVVGSEGLEDERKVHEIILAGEPISVEQLEQLGTCDVAWQAAQHH